MAPGAARQGDPVSGTDQHIIVPFSGTPAPVGHPFSGTITQDCSRDVLINGKGAATQGSAATNTVPHLPQGGSFQSPPSNRGTIDGGSATVLVNSKPLARRDDKVSTCDDLHIPGNSTITSASTDVEVS